MHEACEEFKFAVKYESKRFVNITIERLLTNKDENKALKFSSIKKFSPIKK